MATVIVFWASIMALLLFVLEVICKGIASLFYALQSTLGVSFKTGVSVLGAVILVEILGYMINSILIGKIWSFIGNGIILFIAISIVIALFGSLGELILYYGEIALAFLWIMAVKLSVSGASVCGKGHDYFWKIVVDNLEKC